MEIIFDSQNPSTELSIILLDWSCRESFHTLECLSKQNIPRESYEVIWVEYYGRRARWIEIEIKRPVGRAGVRLSTDGWSWACPWTFVITNTSCSTRAFSPLKAG